MRKAASGLVFDPREPGPMAVIVDADDCRYWEQRAIEQIRELHQMEGSSLTLSDAHCQERLRNACSLLLLSLVKRGQTG